MGSTDSEQAKFILGGVEDEAPPVFEPGALNDHECAMLAEEAIGEYTFTETGKRLMQMRIEAAKEWHRKQRLRVR